MRVLCTDLLRNTDMPVLWPRERSKLAERTGYVVRTHQQMYESNGESFFCQHTSSMLSKVSDRYPFHAS